MTRIVLASTSPRRRKIMDEMGMPYIAVAPRFDEAPRPDLFPAEEARLFAYEKAKSVSADFPGAVIIGCDTLIEYEGHKVGKPRNVEDAKDILAFLCGRTHRIYTAVSLLNTEDEMHTEHLETVDVTMRAAAPAEIAAYVATGEPLDKAGAYAIQGHGRKLVAKIQGDYWSAVGLPAAWIARKLKEYGFTVREINWPEGVAS